jgi:hepatocyte growth factor-regulated tyrosine kinase substrate
MPSSIISLNVNQKSNADQDAEIDEFVATMRSQVEIFINRMKSNSSRGRSIANDTSVQTLFMNITSMHSRLLTYIKEMDDKRLWYEQLQDKLAQVKDSRAALDVLRQEHIEKMRRIAEEQERQRQMQMAYKLEIMRKKKQEYLQYQRQLALQRIQEQEREMQMRQEQQKAQYMLSNVPYPAFVSPPGNQQGSPMHAGANQQFNVGQQFSGQFPNQMGMPQAPAYGQMQMNGQTYPPQQQNVPPQSAFMPINPAQNTMPPGSIMPGGMNQQMVPPGSQIPPQQPIPMMQMTQPQQQQQQQNGGADTNGMVNMQNSNFQHNPHQPIPQMQIQQQQQIPMQQPAPMQQQQPPQQQQIPMQQPTPMQQQQPPQQPEAKEVETAELISFD